LKILILGGYGVFGGRLVELLSDLNEVEILVCGRSYNKADAFCRSHERKAKLFPIALNRNAVAQELAKHQPDIIVDASGPFQSYGDHPYVVIEACIAAKVNYLDFADAADFVFGVSRLNQQAKDAGVFVLSGVSSFPVLTAAVLREIAKEITIETVTGGIAPSPFAGVGLNVIRAVAGYAGGQVKLTRNGQPDIAKGLAESLRFTISTPGHLPLQNLRFSLIDVPDLQVIPPDHKSLTDIWIGAAPLPESLHRILNLLSKLRTTLKLPSLEPLAPLFFWVQNLMRFGEHRGGMFVHATGKKNGNDAEITWHLIAEGNDGLYIPSMAIEAIIRKSIDKKFPATGARPASSSLSLADYEILFKNRQIFTGFRNSQEKTGSIYQQILGSAYQKLPPQLQTIHKGKAPQKWSGSAQVSVGTNPLAVLTAKIIGLPQKAGNIPVSVNFTTKSGIQRWERDFNGSKFTSFQKLGAGRNDQLLLEQFGPITIALALIINDKKLFLVPRSWQFLGIPLPKFLLPSEASFEEERDGLFRFDVTMKVPIIGLIVAYKGTLSPEKE